MRKNEWAALHIWFSVLFLLVTVFHLVFNWRPLVSYFKDRLTRRVGFRWEWAVALALCTAVFAGTQARVKALQREPGDKCCNFSAGGGSDTRKPQPAKKRKSNIDL